MPSLQEETAVLTMSDIHFGKETTQFNREICEKKLYETVDRVISIKSKLKGYKLSELRIFMLGDFNDGTNIYPTQAYHQDVTNVDDQADQISSILAKCMTRLCKKFDRVIAECVPGNHGRAGKFANEAANWDITAYRLLALKCQNVENFELRMGEKPDIFMRMVEIRGHRFLIYHGHSIRCYANIPWYGMLLRTSRWNLIRDISPLDVVVMGHFHTCGDWEINDTSIMLSGTMVEGDQWAKEELGWVSRNKWWFFGVCDERPTTWMFKLEV